MVGLDIEIRLANLLIAVGSGEQGVEDSREKLASHRDFDPLLMFRLIDTKNKGYLILEDIMGFLRYYLLT